MSRASAAVAISRLSSRAIRTVRSDQHLVGRRHAFAVVAVVFQAHADMPAQKQRLGRSRQLAGPMADGRHQTDCGGSILIIAVSRSWLYGIPALEITIRSKHDIDVVRGLS